MRHLIIALVAIFLSLALVVVESCADVPYNAADLSIWMGMFNSLKMSSGSFCNSREAFADPCCECNRKDNEEVYVHCKTVAGKRFINEVVIKNNAIGGILPENATRMLYLNKLELQGNGIMTPEAPFPCYKKKEFCDDMDTCKFCLKGDKACYNGLFCQVKMQSSKKTLTNPSVLPLDTKQASTSAPIITFAPTMSNIVITKVPVVTDSPEPGTPTSSNSADEYEYGEYEYETTSNENVDSKLSVADSHVVKKEEYEYEDSGLDLENIDSDIVIVDTKTSNSKVSPKTPKTPAQHIGWGMFTMFPLFCMLAIASVAARNTKTNGSWYSFNKNDPSANQPMTKLKAPRYSHSTNTSEDEDYSFWQQQSSYLTRSKSAMTHRTLETTEEPNPVAIPTAEAEVDLFLEAAMKSSKSKKKQKNDEETDELIPKDYKPLII